jgi:hypothetical protein
MGGWRPTTAESDPAGCQKPRSLDGLKPELWLSQFDRDGMDTALPSGMKGQARRREALRDRTGSKCQSGVLKQPLEERWPEMISVGNSFFGPYKGAEPVPPWEWRRQRRERAE